MIANSRFQEKFTLRPDAEDYLFSLTNGHPGGLSSVLKYIHGFYRHAIENRDLSVMIKEHVVDSLKPDQDVWDILTQEPISVHCPRAVGSPRKLQTSSLRFWRKEMYYVSRTKRQKHVTSADGCTECKYSERMVTTRKSMCFLRDSMKSGSNTTSQKERKVYPQNSKIYEI